jgi:signal transduction histidine kinase
MNFRARLLLGFGAVSLAPLLALAIGGRRAMDRRLAEQDEARVAALVAVTREEIARRSADVGDRLAALGDALADDNRFRLAALRRDPAERRYLLDWAGRAMRETGLVMLQLQDEHGRIVSSGHFRNEYDRLDPELPALLSHAPGGAALIVARAPDGPFLVLARATPLIVGGRHFTLVGGVRPDVALTAAGDLRAALDTAELGARSSAPGRVPPFAFIPVPYLAATDSGRVLTDAHVVITRDMAPLEALRASVSRWFAGAVALAVAGAVLAGTWMAARVSRPLSALAASAAHIDLERDDGRFASARGDEIGALARTLDAMTRRLRASAAAVREAERRAAVGDLARQVNHDLRNGLAPIRHVVRHLTEVEHASPERLATVFAERRATLEASVTYLDTLVKSYARLAPRGARRPCEVNAVAREVSLRAAGRARVALQLDERLPRVDADPLALRRILENLAGNAVDALDGAEGTITIATEPLANGARLTVADDGTGMTPEQLARAFDDFYTTKPDGTGLGLSIVRRLATDMGASVTLESTRGEGTRAIVTFHRSTS